MSQPRPPDHSTFPAQQSPWIRLGGSGGPASEPIRSMTASTNRASSGRSAPASTARRRKGSSLRCAYHSGQPGGWGVLSSGRLAMKPGHGAPKASAPAACSRARSAPNPNAAPGVDRCGGIIETTSAAGVTASTSGTGTAAASASQRRPFASAANAAEVCCGASSPEATALANARRPPDRVTMRCW